MEGELVLVEPLAPEHEAGLFAAGHDREMWTYLSAFPDAYETRLALRPEHRWLEIGWTWLGRPWWRTGANVETKLLLFGRAFELLGCERVELKCDARNARSRAAMEALPAQFEGIHRRLWRSPAGAGATPRGTA